MTGALRWRFQTREGGQVRTVTKQTRESARVAAENALAAQGDGLAWLSLPLARRRFLEAVDAAVPSGDEASVLAWIRSRAAGCLVDSAVARFAAWKREGAGEKTPHLARVVSVLESFASGFSGRMVGDIAAADLSAWWEERGAGLSAKRRRDLRAALVTFWRWCRAESLVPPDAVTIAERLPAPAVGHGERRVLTPAELAGVMAAVGREWRAWVVLGAFAGLRPEEISPAQRGGSSKRDKRGLRCEEIDWRFGVLRIAPETSKVSLPRIVPMNDALRAGLAWAGLEDGMAGRVVLRNPVESGETARLAKLLFGGVWPKDALRHSYGSYRNAVVRDLGRVAEEMGTSVSMLHRHYHNPRSEDEGLAWFAVRPEVTKNAASVAS